MQLSCPSCRHNVAGPKRRLSIARIHKALDMQKPDALQTPDSVTLEVLTLLRKPHVACLGAYILPDNDPPQPSPSGTPAQPVIRVGHLETTEAGTLSGWSGRLDAAARRMLPRHLLRRCRILSSLSLGSICRQRVAITARTGEEAVFTFELLKDSSFPINISPSPLPQPTTAPQQTETRTLSRAVSPGGGGSDDEWGYSQQPVTLPSVWKVSRVHRDSSNDMQDVPSGPHPRLPPELVITHQLRELSSGNLQAAAAYTAQEPLLPQQGPDDT